MKWVGIVYLAGAMVPVRSGPPRRWRWVAWLDAHALAEQNREQFAAMPLVVKTVRYRRLNKGDT